MATPIHRNLQGFNPAVGLAGVSQLGTTQVGVSTLPPNLSPTPSLEQMTAAVTPFAKTVGLDHFLSAVLQPPNMNAELLKPVHFHREKAAALDVLARHVPELQALQQKKPSRQRHARQLPLPNARSLTVRVDWLQKLF